MLNRLLVVINLRVSIGSCSMETELYLVNAVTESEEWMVFSFDHADKFIRACSAQVIRIPGCCGYKWSHRPLQDEFFEGKSNVKFVIEVDLVEKIFELVTIYLIVSECFERCQI